LSINSYKDLLVWKKSMLLAKEIYMLVKILPKTEQYNLSSQMRRAAVSIFSNIAEGYGREFTKEYVKFLKISRGSKDELESQLIFCLCIDYLSEEETKTAFIYLDEIGKMLNSLINKLSVPNA